MTQALTKLAAVQNPGLNLFDVPPTDYSLAESRYVPINPFTTGIHPIDFQIDPQDDFINLAKSYFEVELQLKLDNDGNIANDTLVTICNNFIHSLFKQINVCLNGMLISPQTDNYHHKAFTDTVIHNDRDDGETILKPEGWFNGLTCRDASGTALTANQLNPAHDDFKALSQDEQNWVKSVKPFNGGAKVVFRFQTLPQSVSTQQTTHARGANAKFKCTSTVVKFGVKNMAELDISETLQPTILK